MENTEFDVVRNFGFINEYTVGVKGDSTTIFYNLAGTPRDNLAVTREGGFINISVGGETVKNFVAKESQEVSAAYSDGMLTIKINQTKPEVKKVTIL